MEVTFGGGSATITVERRYGSAGAVSVTAMGSDASAISGEDFDAVKQAVSIVQILDHY